MSGSYPLAKFLAFALVAILFSGGLVVLIGNIKLFESAHRYEAEFDDAMGLLVNDGVKVAGVEVGKVERIRLERGRAVVTFSVRDDVVVGEDSLVAIRWRGVIGLRYLYVYPMGEGAVDPGHRFPPERTIAPADFALLLERLTPVLRALEPEVGNLVVQALEEALVGREETVQRLIAEAGSLTQALADRDQTIGRLLVNAATLLDAYAERDGELRDLLSSMASVADTVSDRNDQIEALVVQLADTQSELRRFLEQNDGELRDLLGALDDVTAVLAVNRDNFEDVVTYLGEGIVSYHRISRWGQWFNVRAVGTSIAEEMHSSERGAAMPPRRPDPHATQGHATTSMAGLFRGLQGGVR